jgi:HK97 family phage major capsid protein
MMDPIQQLRELRAGLIEQAGAMLNKAEAENRDLSEAEQGEYNDFVSQANGVQTRIERLESQRAMEMQMTASQAAPIHRMEAPRINRLPRGSSETQAFSHWVRTGDGGGLRELRASNATDMNVGTDADGGYAVPDGHFQGIIARRDESMLAARLGIRLIPGQGTTVNVPLDAEADGEFVSTSEGSGNDQDAPALGTKALTLVKYTKRVDLSLELLEDEDSRILDFLADFVGRGMAKTHNNLLLTEVASNGTDFGNFASASAIAAGELEAICGNVDLSHYLDDTASVAWVMRSSTLWAIRALTGTERLYAEQTLGSAAPGQLLGYPVALSDKAAAIGASAKSVYFGNWNFVGYREAPGFTVLRDPYSKASTGQISLHYYFRTVYGVLQAEAIGYKDHPTG